MLLYGVDGFTDPTKSYQKQFTKRYKKISEVRPIKHLLDIQQYKIMQIFWEADGKPLTKTDIHNACPAMDMITIQNQFPYLLYEKFITYHRLITTEDQGIDITYKVVKTEQQYWDSKAVQLRLSFHTGFGLAMQNLKEWIISFFTPIV